MTAPAYPAAPAQNPGRVLGIVGLILAILPTLQLFGLIVSIIGLVQSRKAGQSNGFAVAGIIISILFMVVSILLVVFAGTFFLSIFGNLAEVCATYGPGEHVIDGVEYRCGVS